MRTSQLRAVPYAAIYLSTVALAASLFVRLNFGSLEPRYVRQFLESAPGLIRGVDAGIWAEFILLVIITPVATSAAMIFILDQSRRPVVFSLLSSFLMLTTALFFYNPFLLEESEDQPASANGLQSIDGLASPSSDIIHIYVESLSADLDFDAKFDNPHQSLANALGKEAHILEVGWHADMAPTTINGVGSSICGWTETPRGFADKDSVNFLSAEQTCISDFLTSMGYEASFFQAASGDFQKKADFLRLHSVEVYEQETWRGIGAIETNGSWGQSIHDDRLFDHGRALLNNKILSGEPYYLSGLSLDTHYPYFVPEDCREAHPVSAMEQAYICSAEVIADFVSWAKTNVSRATLIIVQGDHPNTNSGTDSERFFFGSVCTGRYLDQVSHPSMVSDIPNFILSASSLCHN